MNEGFITLSCYVTLSLDHYDRIQECARDLDLSLQSVLSAVINTSVRRHFERSSAAPSEEVQE